ncbi:hypothetical protein K32_26150 [Kaistia sp. 32K]|nr:hypothetical protein K32_26150 [Kaistia sp. 32K]
MSAKPYLHLCKKLEPGTAHLPEWPEGARLVEFTPQLAEASHRLLRSAYSQGGGEVPEYPSWLNALLNDPEYDPALVFPVLDSSGRVIAFAQCWTSGFVKNLAVDASRRRQGLGEALLQHILNVFTRRGSQRLCLKVEADNPSGAERLYRRLGFDDFREG